MPADINQLHDQARRAIESAETSFADRARDAARYLAEARELGAKPQASAEAIGKSRPWVLALLKWHDGGYKTAVPFPRATRRSVSQADKKKSADPETADLLPRAFDDVVTRLAKLAAKPISELVRTAHAPSELESLAAFLSEVAKAMKMKVAA